MATSARSIASLSLSFGLVNVPVKLFSATESGSEIHFNLLAKDGSRLKQQYVNERTKKVVERKDMVKGYEVEDERFVLFSPEELKALEEGGSHVVEIVSFVPLASIDPLFYDKSYLLAPDKRGEKPYALLMEALRQSERCALAKWAWKTKQYVVQIRAHDDGLILHQLRYADEVRSLGELEIPKAAVSKTELQLALQLVDQIAADTFDPDAFHDEEKARVLAAIDEKVKGKEIVASGHEEAAAAGSGQVIDLMDALRASLGPKTPSKDNKDSKPGKDDKDGKTAKVTELKPKAKAAAKPSRRTAVEPAAEAAPEPAPARKRAHR